jgi:hypothetical protein
MFGSTVSVFSDRDSVLSAMTGLLQPEGYFGRRRHPVLRREPLRIGCETFVSSYAPTVRPEPDHPGLSADHIPDLPLSSQGDHRSARWVARFKEAA